AWLADMLLYRLGRVPELNRIKLLELVGVRLRPAEPARTAVTFPVLPGHPRPYLEIPALTRVQADPRRDHRRPILVETDRSLYALRARLAGVVVSVGASNAELTVENVNPARGFLPFGPTGSVGGRLLLGFTEALPSVAVELTVWTAGTERAPAWV